MFFGVTFSFNYCSRHIYCFSSKQLFKLAVVVSCHETIKSKPYFQTEKCYLANKMQEKIYFEDHITDKYKTQVTFLVFEFDDVTWKQSLFSTGNAEITWSPPQLTLDLYGQDSWLDLGLRSKSCYVDVKYCNHTGISITFWVSFREASTTQGLIEFGSGDCGLMLVRTSDHEINATIRSMELGNTWSVQSLNASIGDWMWHHLAITWNATGDLHLFINGTRYK